ncbi:23S rRNA (guanosine(2251)-2'-O)-methyltransferase RlmB [Candidatus Marinimicrobia bacterium]|jgi:23S rRNA (guanosine2251-2'-O)-methyltransferase|nr:23S rRNA (guanosine(2251)-2'-O)-methyltransferase RlmB [Candidatus Neomarinimicrobiota bacterium]
MKKTNINTFTLFGLNNSIAILRSKTFKIINIDLMEDGRALKEKKIKILIENKKINKMKKYQFNQKYPEKRSQGIAITFSGDIIRKEIPSFHNQENACLLVLDQIEDPQNFGQIIRTAECAGIDGIVFPRHHSAPINETVLQVSQGAFVNMPIYEITNIRNIFKQFKSDGFWLIGIENSIDAKPWFKVEYGGKAVIVLGSEGKGIRKMVLESCDFKSTIPMKGKINSLNVSATASAILFERLRQLEGN